MQALKHCVPLIVQSRPGAAGSCRVRVTSPVEILKSFLEQDSINIFHRDGAQRTLVLLRFPGLKKKILGPVVPPCVRAVQWQEAASGPGRTRVVPSGPSVREHRRSPAPGFLRAAAACSPVAVARSRRDSRTLSSLAL